MSWDQYQMLRRRWKGQGLAPAAKNPVTKRTTRGQQNVALEDEIIIFEGPVVKPFEKFRHRS